MNSPHDFLMEFMKQIVHTENVDKRPQIVQQWTEKLEAREAEIGREFYERYLKESEVIKTTWDGPTDYRPVVEAMDGCREAAKKAAGIE